MEPIKTDTSALRTLIAAVEQLAETDYTANSYKVVAEKLQEAKAVLEKTNPSTEEVKKAELALQNAQKALVVRASKESVDVLKRLVEDGKKMKDAYTEEAFKDADSVRFGTRFIDRSIKYGGSNYKRSRAILIYSYRCIA